MDHTSNRYPVKKIVIFALLSLLPAFTGAYPVFGHGGKSHGGTGFSSLQAVQKATGFYDRLITSGKLDEAWETTLVSIIVSNRQSGEKQEYVVQFKRAAGDPGAVYFFFDRKGEYTGSNFTGK